jgi:hypothetical protein
MITGICIGSDRGLEVTVTSISAKSSSWPPALWNGLFRKKEETYSHNNQQKAALMHFAFELVDI